MEFTDAFNETADIVTGLMNGLTPEHREMQTPCKKWTVHDLANHMVMGGTMMADVLEANELGDFSADYIPDGPVAGWSGAVEAMQTAITPENLSSPRVSPFGEFPGAMFASVMVADQLIHAWDLAKASDQPIEPSDEVVEFARTAMAGVMQPEARNGDMFDLEQPVDDDASPMDKLAAFSGRSVS
ncbi:MAG: TIGR03086 family metal-binding protein [Actinomycetota bacterium]